MRTYPDAIPHELTKGGEPMNVARDEHLAIIGHKDTHAYERRLRALAWKKSKDRPMFPNTAGSSEHSATCTPWFMSAGSGCIGIEPQ